MLKLWDRVVVPDGRGGRVVCLSGGRACVWHGSKKGETWWPASELMPAQPRQMELFT